LGKFSGHKLQLLLAGSLSRKAEPILLHHMTDSLNLVQKFYQNVMPDIRDDEFQMIAEKYVVKTLKKGEILIQPGQICDWTGLVVSGAYRNFQTIEGKEIVTQFFLPGMVISDYISYVTGMKSMVTIDTIQQGEVWLINRDAATELIQKWPRFYKLIIRYLNTIYIQNYERTISLQLDSAETRYLKLMATRPEIVRQIPVYMIASYLGLSPEALSRIRKKLSSEHR
jgi:CRP-like cAMP-binding protein